MESIVAKIIFQEEKIEEALAAIKELMAEVAKEEGTVLYTLNREPNHPATLIMMERYKDKAALKTHSTTPYFKAFFKKAVPWMAKEPEITIMEELASI